MSRTSRGRRKPPPSTNRSPTWLLVGLLTAAAAAAAAFFFLRPSDSGGQAAWTRFGSQDVHSLAFADGDARHLLFGHHGGLRESRDGGRTWAELPVRDDAMSTSAAADGSIVIAGHEVFMASRDGGATWVSIKGDLPSLDIHGFTRDPADSSRMWAYLATGGLWESTDFGSHWTRVREDNVLFPVAVRAGSTTRLLGVDVNGLVASPDGGRSWQPLSKPPTYPLTALAASADGTVLYAGAPDGLFRSGDGGRSWVPTAYEGSAFAVATTADGRVVGVVSRETEFFRSDDGGATWPGPS